MSFKHILLLSSCVYASSAISESIPEGSTIVSCNDVAGWPPYNYVTPNKGVAGYDVNVLNTILTKHKLASKLEMVPWKRCLKVAEDGQKYQLIPSVSHNAEREKSYVFTRPYYTITPSYFYAAKRYPHGLNIKSIGEFKNYKVCGVAGYNYSNFGIPEESIESGTRTIPQLIEKTINARCDVFLARYELLAGFAKMGDDFIEKHNLQYAGVPGVESEKFHMMISRKYPHAEALKKILDNEIANLESQGQLKTMVDDSINEVGQYFSKD